MTKVLQHPVVTSFVDLSTAQAYKYKPAWKLKDWLRENHLDYYLESFVRSELVNLKDILRLQLPDEELYDELEIVMAGHKKRLERAGKSKNCFSDIQGTNMGYL